MGFVPGVLWLRHVLVQVHDIAQRTERRRPIGFTRRQARVQSRGTGSSPICLSPGERAVHRLADIHDSEVVAARGIGCVRRAEGIHRACCPVRSIVTHVKQTEKVGLPLAGCLGWIEKVIAPTVDVPVRVVVCGFAIGSHENACSVVLPHGTTHPPCVPEANFPPLLTKLSLPR